MTKLVPRANLHPAHVMFLGLLGLSSRWTPVHEGFNASAAFCIQAKILLRKILLRSHEITEDLTGFDSSGCHLVEKTGRGSNSPIRKDQRL